MSDVKATAAKDNQKGKTGIILYPLLFALYPFINTYSSNINIIYNPGDLILPALVTLVVTGIVWAVLSFLWKDAARAALLTLIMELLFFSYGHIYELLKLDERGVSDAVLLAIWAVILMAAIVLIFRYGKNTGAATGTLNVVAGVLLAIPILSILLFTFNGRQNVAHGSAKAYDISDEARGYDQLPDIYYIILDGYPRADVLEEFYDYDNSEFVDALEVLDFYIASDSHTNYVFTGASLASSLNFNYLQDLLPEDVDASSHDLAPLYNLMQENSLCRTLREIGYYYVIYDSSWEPTSESECADTVRSLHQVNELDSLLLQTTLLRPLVISDIAADLRASRLFILDDLPGVAELDQPTLTFAHIILPHFPILFDREGGIPEDPPQGVRLWAGTGLTPEARTYYLDQVYFTSQQIEKTLA
ncbi:MAG TPA: hypothetical protein VJZ27_01620, partial [Aggregatilineales bacterium]|nr:hypothetical protein [Aggregatilineales bacterium]